MVKRKGLFPTFWVIILALAVAWFSKEMGWLNLDLPWLPIIVIIIALGAIINHLTGK